MEPGSVEKNDDINQDISNEPKKNDDLHKDIVDKPEKSNNLGEKNLENIDTTDANQTSIKDSTKNMNSPGNENVMEITELSETTTTQTSHKPEDDQEEMPMEVDQDEILEHVETVSNKSLEIVDDENQIETSEKVNKDQISNKEKCIINSKEVCNDKSDIVSKDGIHDEKEVGENEKTSSVDVANLVSTDDSSNSQEQNFTKKNSVESTKEPLQNDISDSIQECVDVDMENKSEKKTHSEVIGEVEGTEFVQLNQEREDSQSSFSRSENQADAENDPFEGDNLSIPTDSVEAMEVDSGRTNKNSMSNEETGSRKLSLEKDKVIKKFAIFIFIYFVYLLGELLLN